MSFNVFNFATGRYIIPKPSSKFTSIEEVKSYTVNVLEALELSDDWKVDVNKSKRAIGTCDLLKKTIFLSEILISDLIKYHNSEIKSTVLHEVAHAIVHEINKNYYVRPHGKEWKRCCQLLGIVPQVKYKPNEEMHKSFLLRNNTKAKYALILETTGEVCRFYKRKPRINLERLYLRGRKEETLGKLICKPIEEIKIS